MNVRKFLIQCTVLMVLVLGSLWVATSARADGPGSEPTPTDPYFREEAPERMVECDNNVFVPMGEGGTWDCPPIQEQLPEERIGRQIDCPDGSVGRVIDVEGNTSCDEPANVISTEESQQPRITPSEAFLYGMGAIGLILLSVALYYALRPRSDS